MKKIKTKMMRIFGVFIFLVFLSQSFAQTSIRNRVWTLPEIDITSSITTNDTIICVGTKNGEGMIVCFNTTTFDTIWTRTVSATFLYDIEKIQNKLVVVGKRQTGVEFADFWIGKLNLNGSLVWQKTIKRSNFNLLSGVTQVGSDIVAVGGASGKNALLLNAIIMRLNQNGDTLWTKTLGSGELNDVVATSANEFIALGSANSNFWLVKANLSKNIILNKQVDINGKDECKKIIKRDANRFSVFGNTDKSCVKWFDINANCDSIVGSNGGLSSQMMVYDAIFEGDDIMVTGSSDPVQFALKKIINKKEDWSYVGGIPDYPDYGATVKKLPNGNYMVLGITQPNGESTQFFASEINPPSDYCQATINLGADAVICANESATITATGVWKSFLWSNGATSQSIVTNSAGDYIVTVTDAKGCVAKDTISVYKRAPISINLGTDVTICADRSKRLNATGVWKSFLWSNGATTPSIVTNSAGTYSVTVSDVNGCIAKDTISVFKRAPIAINLGPDVSVCADEPVTLTADVSWQDRLWNTTWMWKKKSDSITHHYVIATDIDGCSAKDSIVAFRRKPIKVNLGSDVKVYSDNTTTLTASGNWKSFLWSNGSTSQSIVTNSVGNYSVIVTDHKGCTAKDTIVVSKGSLEGVVVSHSGGILGPNDVQLKVYIKDDVTGKYSKDYFISDTIKGGYFPLVNTAGQTFVIQAVRKNESNIKNINDTYYNKIQVLDSAIAITGDTSPRIIEIKMIEAPLANKEIKKTNYFKVGPNPFNETINIIADINNFDVLIFELNGKLIRNYKNVKEIDASSLTSGIYFLKVIYKNEVSVFKMIKN